MGLEPSRSLTMSSRLALSIYLVLIAVNWTGAVGHRRIVRHYQPSASAAWPSRIPFRELQRVGRQFQLAESIESSSFIPLGGNIPLEPEHRSIDPVHHADVQHSEPVAPPQIPVNVPVPVPVAQPYQPVAQLPVAQPLVQQPLLQPVVQSVLQGPRPPYGPPVASNQENGRQSWPDHNTQQGAIHQAPQVDRRNSYNPPSHSTFDSSSSQFSHRSFEMPPSPAQLGFPSVSSTEENWHYDVNWADFSAKKRRRRSPQKTTAPRRRTPVNSEQQDNIALEGRRGAESRVPAPTSNSRPAQNERPEREGSAYKQEYDGPYVYTQLFGPPYEVGYIRSPIPSKHVYEDYLQFVRSWSSASRDAVDEQMRKNPSLAKEYSSVKYADETPAYKETQKESYKEPEYKEPAYKPTAQAYKEPEYKEPAYKEPEYKEPAYKEPAYKEPAPAYKEPVYSEPAYKEPEYKEPAYKEPAYKEPAYKEPVQAYKEPAYKEPEYKEPAYKEPAYKEPAYKEPVQAYKEPEYKEPAYKEPAYKEPAYKEPAPAYKEPEYKEPAYKEPAYKEPAYKEPAYKEPAPAYKEPEYKEPAYKEPAYKEPAYKEPAYKEPAQDYKEEAYREQARTEPVFREETYRDSSRREPAYKETAHKSPAYKEESYPAPSIDYHSPKTDYAAPETEFRPTSRPYSAVGPKSPVLIERDFVPIKQSGPSQQYDSPTTYRTTTAASYNNYDAPATYDILKPFEKTKQSNAYPAPSYEAPTAVYEPVTAKYKAPIESYDQTAYEAPKRYENPPPRDSSKKYEATPSRPSSPSVAYYQPPTRYVEPPQYPSKNAPGYSESKPYETSSAKYESPAPSYESPAKYSEPAYEAPKKYETATRYPEYATTKTYKQDGYRIEPLTTPAYKEPYGSDDYAPSSYKDDVDLSSTSYQAVSQNYDTPKDDYKPPSAYTNKEESYSSGSKDAYLPASYDDKKPDDSYKADAAPGYEASTTKKKHYPVIIGRYQVTDSSAFLPKKVEGSGGSSSGIKSVGSQVHGANGEEYVVYYLPYGQPLPVPVKRKRRSAQEEPVYTIRRWKSLADRQVRRQGRRLSGQRQLEEQVLSPEEVHKLVKYPAPNNYRTTTIQPVETTDEVVVTDTPAVVEQQQTADPVVQEVEQSVPVVQEVEQSVPVVQEVEQSAPVVQEEPEIVEEIKEQVPEVVQEEIVPAHVDETVPVQVDEPAPIQLDENVPAHEEIQQEDLPATVEQIHDEKQEPEFVQEENLPPIVEEEPAKVHEIQSDVDDVVVPVSPESDGPVSVDEIVLAQIEEELKDSLVPATGGESHGVPDSELIEETPVVGEIIVVKEVPVDQEPAVEDDGESGVDDVSFITETEEEPAVVPQLTYPPPPQKSSYKKKHPAITELPSILPGLTQKPVKYIKPPGIAVDPKHEWNGYSTWWTKLGNRVAKIYNYE